MASSSAVKLPHNIFLSHSSDQKPFVEQLAHDLLRVHQNPFFDAFCDSLPKGQEWSERMLEEARSCQLAVVVVSEEYFTTSKWTMLELHEIVFTLAKNVLPLFYKLSPEDCKSETNLTRWRSTWESLELDSTKCMAALEKLTNWNGETFQTASNRSGHYSSEVEYRRRIVSNICKCLPSEIAYEESYVQGRELLHEDLQAVENTFIHAEHHCETAPGSCVVGMHGIGGTGKTTLCKSMVNFFYSHYGGKSCLMELPTRCDEGKILQQCKKALYELTELSDSILAKASHMDQIITLFNDHMKHHKFFLAIDNVWPRSEEFVRRILKAGFGRGTRVLITARSPHLLRRLLPKCKNSICLTHVPSVDAKSALDMLLHYGPEWFFEQPNNECINIVATCLFSNHYHPLLLKAIGSQLRAKGPERKDRAEFLNCEYSSAVEERVLGVIRTSYDYLRNEDLRRIFLDVALCLPICDLKFFSAVDWLGLLHGMDSKSMKVYISELEEAGLLVFHRPQEEIEVHDLYVDCARWIASNCSRWLYCSSVEPSADFTCSERKRKRGTGWTSKPHDSVKWSKLERVVLLSQAGDKWLKEMCTNRRRSNVKLVIVHWQQQINDDDSREALAQVNLEGMRNLRILEFKNSGWRLEGLQHASKSLGRLVAEYCECETWGVGCLTALRTLIFTGTDLTNALDLTRCTNLEHLALMENTRLLPRLGDMRKLRGPDFVAKLFSFDSLRLLKELELHGLDLERGDVGSLNKLEALQELSLRGCKLPATGDFRISELKRLKRLDLSFCSGASDCLQMVAPSKFERLELKGWRGQAFRVSPRLGRVVVVDMRRLIGEGLICSTVSDIARLHPQTEKLRIEWNSELGLSLPTELTSPITGLRDVELSDCGFLMESASLLPDLKVLTFQGSTKLLPDLSSLLGLETLELFCCWDLEGFTGLPPKLRKIKVCVCPSLQIPPHLLYLVERVVLPSILPVSNIPFSTT